MTYPKPSAYEEWEISKQDAFNKAAYKSAEKCSDVAAGLFKKLWDATKESNQAWECIDLLAKTDTAVAEVLHDLNTDLSNATYKYRKATNQLCGH
jgi:hypothetical protein